MLYSKPTSPDEWPVPVGKVTSNNRVVIYNKDLSDALFFFKVGGWPRGGGGVQGEDEDVSSVCVWGGLGVR